MVALGANAVGCSGKPLGIVAIGSGNDFARGLDLPVNRVETAVEGIVGAIVRGTHIDVDMGLVTRCLTVMPSIRPTEPMFHSRARRSTAIMRACCRAVWTQASTTAPIIRILAEWLAAVFRRGHRGADTHRKATDTTSRPRWPTVRWR